MEFENIKFKNYKDEKELKEYLLSNEDKIELKESAVNLLFLFRNAIESGKSYQTLIFPVLAGRTLPYFVKGLLEGQFDDYKPNMLYIQTSSSKSIEQNLINDRIKEIVGKSPGPYLVIDDNIGQLSTFSTIEKCFKDNKVKEKITYFGFLGNKPDDRPDLKTRKDVLAFYNNLSNKKDIHIGKLGGQFLFAGFTSQYTLSLTKKDKGSKYEKVNLDGDDHFSWPWEPSEEAVKQIKKLYPDREEALREYKKLFKSNINTAASLLRKELFEFGKEVGKELKS